MRAVSVERGIDPRDTALIAFGGAGPLHAAAIAREISIPRVVVPKLPGNFSALGMLMAQWRHDFVRTLVGQFGEINATDAARAFAELRTAGEAALSRDYPSRDQLARARFDFAADLRYRGQEHTIAIAVAGADDLTGDTETTRLKFNQQHDRRYGHAAPDQSIEIVNLRLTVTLPRMEDVIGALAVAAVDAGRTRGRTAPAGHIRRSGAGGRGAHPVAARAGGRSRDRRAGGDRGAELDHAHRSRRPRRGGRERAYHRDAGGARMMPEFVMPGLVPIHVLLQCCSKDVDGTGTRACPSSAA